MQSKKRRQSVWEAEQRKEVSSSKASCTRSIYMLTVRHWDQMPASRSSVAGMPLPQMTFKPSQHFGFGKDDPSGKDLSWIGDVSDELVVHISLRNFEAAVTLIEQGACGDWTCWTGMVLTTLFFVGMSAARTAIPLVHADANAAALLRSKVDARHGELTAALLEDLRAPGIAKSGVVRHAAWLLRLGEVDRARDVFLAGRAALVKKRVKQIKFEGDIGVYISELAVVVFTLIKNTCEWYMAAFKDNKLASGENVVCLIGFW